MPSRHTLTSNKGTLTFLVPEHDHTSARIQWLYETNDPEGITMDQAKDLQRQAGYEPAGYSFERFEQLAPGAYSWYCWKSCD